MKNNNKPVFAWIFFGLTAASVTAAVIFDFSTRPAGDNFALGEMLGVIMTPFMPLSFAFVGALIISRQPRNVIGWLMMLPGVSLFMLVDVFLRPYLNGLLPPPESPSPIFLLILWFSNWNWLLLVFPLMFIMVLFPTGRPLTPRWRWLIYFGVGLMTLFILFITFADSLAPGAGGVDWVLANPIGFLDVEWIEYMLAPFLVGLPIWVILCVVSLLIRFRRARGVEREIEFSEAGVNLKLRVDRIDRNSLVFRAEQPEDGHLERRERGSLRQHLHLDVRHVGHGVDRQSPHAGYARRDE